ncbi:uncharacterized protein [Montipora capricornis]|uniref:uncharacterized protein n=1 Tax=Montipora capricornis TaxID=246305 RepID=UPI0035F1680C
MGQCSYSQAIQSSTLKVVTAPSVNRVYMDNGTGANTDVSVFQADLKSIPEGAFMIGDVAINVHSSTIPTSSVLLVKPDGSGDVISPPTGYELVWKDSGSGGRQDGSFWRVQAPYGYVALGDVACNGYDPPPPSFTAKYACIRGDLVREGVLNNAPVWTDRGSGAKMDLSIWKVDGDGLCGFFKAQGGYDKPAYKVFVLPAVVSF